MKKIFQLTIFVIPLITIPFFVYGSSFLKWTLGLIFALSYVIYSFKKKIKCSSGLRQIFTSGLCIIGCHFISIPGSINIWAGIATVACILIALIFLHAGNNLSGDKSDDMLWSSIISAASLGVTGIGFLQLLGVDFRGPGYIADPASTLGHRNFVAQFLIIQIPLSVYLIVNSKRKYQRFLGVISSAASCLILLATACRGAWLGLAGAIFVVLLLKMDGILKLSALKKFGCSLVLSGILVTICMNSAIQGRLVSIGDVERGTNRFRILVWTSTLKIVKDHPFRGVGPGNFQFVYPVYRSVAEIQLSGPDVFVDHAHNDYLQVAAETGIPGLICLLWFIVVTIKYSMSRLRSQTSTYHQFIPFVLASLFATFIHAFFSSNLRNPTSLLLISLLIGVITVEGQNSPAQCKRRPIVIISAIPIILILLVGAVLRLYYEIQFARGMKKNAAEQFTDSAVLFESAHNLWPPDYRAAYNSGYAYLKSNRFEKALRMTEHALEKHPNFTSALYNIGVILDNSGKQEEAALAYLRVINLDPVHEDSWNNYAINLSKRNKLIEAKNALQTVLNLNRYNPDAYCNMGILSFKLGQKEEALKYLTWGANLDRVLFFNRATTRHYSLFGRVHFRAVLKFADSNQKSSEWGYVDFASRPETSPSIYNPENLVRMDYDENNKTLLATWDRNPNSVKYILEYKAKGIIGKIELDPIKPIYAKIWNNLGVVYESINDFEKAKEAYIHALFLFPNYDKAVENYQRIIRN